MSGKLLVINPDHTMEVPFEQQLTIGRDVYNSLSLQDPEISRSHAIIFDQGEHILIKDLNSRNGVYVNGDQITEQELRDGDEIVLGSSIIFYNPSENLDIERALSRRGEHLFKSHSKKEGGANAEPVTIFTNSQMDQAVQDLLGNPDNTSFFTLKNAMALLQAQIEMNRKTDTADLFRTALDRAMDTIGATRGIIMESDPNKERLKVRSIRSERTEKSSEVQIAQQVLKVVLRAERCVFCPSIERDNRFSSIGKKMKKNIHSFVACPIMSDQNYYGFIYLESEDDSHEYDYVDLRSLYFVAAHLTGLLLPRETHFAREPVLEGSKSSD